MWLWILPHLSQKQLLTIIVISIAGIAGIAIGSFLGWFFVESLHVN